MEKGLIFEKVIAVMADMEALGKDRRNTQQGYNFRGIDDVYNMVQPIMAKHGVVMRSEILEDRSEERTSKGGGALIYRILKIRYFLTAKDGSEISTMVMGEGMDSGDKAANKAMSVAQKYAILQMFMIPTEEQKDPENESPEVKAKAQPADKPKTAAVPPMTDAQAKEIPDLIVAYQAISKRTDEEMSVAIKKRIQKKYGVAIKGIKDMNTLMADTIIKSLKKWGKDIVDSKAKESAAADEGDPGEGPST